MQVIIMEGNDVHSIAWRIYVRLFLDNLWGWTGVKYLH